MKGFDEARVAVVSGAGVVARHPGLVCVAHCPDVAVLSHLLDLCVDSAGPDPGRILARRLAAWLAGPDAPGESLDFGTLSVSGDRVAVFLSGRVGMVVTDGGARLSGADAAAWTDRLLRRPTGALELTLDGTPRTSPDIAALLDLRGGVVPGAGVHLLPEPTAGDSSHGRFADPVPAAPGPTDSGGVHAAVPAPQPVALDGPAADGPGGGVPRAGAAEPVSTADLLGSVAAQLAVPGGVTGGLSALAGWVDGWDAARTGTYVRPDPLPHDPDRDDLPGWRQAWPHDPAPAAEPAVVARPEPPPGDNAVSGGGDEPSTTGRHAAQRPAAQPPAGESSAVLTPAAPSSDGQPVPGGSGQGVADLPVTDAVDVVGGIDSSAAPPAAGEERQASPGTAGPRGTLLDVAPGVVVSRAALVLDDGSVYPVDAGCLMGRMPESDPRVRTGALRPIVVEDPSGAVSRVHAEVRVSGRDVLIEDVGSRNGTFVAGPGEAGWTPLAAGRPRVLVPGTRVRMGGRILVFESR